MTEYKYPVLVLCEREELNGNMLAYLLGDYYMGIRKVTRMVIGADLLLFEEFPFLFSFLLLLKRLLLFVTCNGI